MGKKWGVGSPENLPVRRLSNFPHPEPRQWLPTCGPFAYPARPLFHYSRGRL